MKNKLFTQKRIEVRFGEVDSMRIVWHGNYVKYFEDGREDFGKKYNMGYLQAEELGYLLPLVEINANYKKPLKYGENAIVETVFVESTSATLIIPFMRKALGQLSAKVARCRCFSIINISYKLPRLPCLKNGNKNGFTRKLKMTKR
jgi:YbgC/YbaW family acyl-CoA thioester hydrolase